MTIQEASRDLKAKLQSIYENGEAETISEWIIESLTGIKCSDRIFQKDKMLNAEQEQQLKQWAERLLQYEPVQYVMNESWFCGLKLYVDKNVLIPRPETEELVEWIISDCKFPVNALSILDIGTGSGCIPIALKKRLPKAQVWSCDISEGALEVAKKNASTLGIDVNFLRLDFLNEEKRNTLYKFDIIVSNPPYIPVKDKLTMHRNVLDFEPGTALFVPDNDALVFYKALADFGKTHLNKKGFIYAEIHESIGKLTKELFESNGYTPTIKKDMQGKERMIRCSVN
ncbi:peptide chain release factor N(5)-glutamine methyltransferase [Terrimonas pollutisoli]|uniref:peptide chain release factor N(5)-glutamine methyltransferase n=1 Tax=Terrimonas pollutisoli TaxID=3034147 RepID=UPI0023EC12A8|nr:peptide chain release factor N(5)-glutamine methyltransferase [Terrimonas sp. H1YJ31]